MRKSEIFAYVALGALLAGCGGGTDNNSQSRTGPTSGGASAVLRAEGVYTGTLSNGQLMESVILETGEIFMMHGDFQSINGQAVIEGTGKADNGIYTSTDARDYDPASAVSFVPVSISASYNLAGQLSGSITGQGQPVSFSGTRVSTTFYDYDQPASLDKIAGSWGGLIIFTITPAGDIGVSSRQCDGHGTIKPRASGKNVFDIEWTFGAIPACPFYGETIKSIAILEGDAIGGIPGSQRLTIMGVDNSRAHGKGWVLTR